MKIQVLYSVFNLSSVRKDNLKRSIRSLKNQNTDHDVEILISDSSDQKEDFSFIGYPFIRYHTDEIKTKFRKAKAENLGFKKLVNTNYFITSDVDIIYPSFFIEKSLELSQKLNKSILWGTFGFNEKYKKKDCIEKEDIIYNNGVENLFNLITKEEAQNLNKFHAPSLFFRYKDFEYTGGKDERFVYKGFLDHDHHFRLQENNLLYFIPTVGTGLFTFHLKHGNDDPSPPKGGVKNFLIFQKNIIRCLENKNNTSLRRENDI
jgi:GT2 family glycosyltransferase